VFGEAQIRKGDIPMPDDYEYGKIPILNRKTRRKRRKARRSLILPLANKKKRTMGLSMASAYS